MTPGLSFVLPLELCDNLDNIEITNIIVINIAVFIIVIIVNFWILLYTTQNACISIHGYFGIVKI